jgi:hypothetical protein
MDIFEIISDYLCELLLKHDYLFNFNWVFPLLKVERSKISNFFDFNHFQKAIGLDGDKTFNIKHITLNHWRKVNSQLILFYFFIYLRVYDPKKGFSVTGSVTVA